MTKERRRGSGEKPEGKNSGRVGGRRGMGRRRGKGEEEREYGDGMQDELQ